MTAGEGEAGGSETKAKQSSKAEKERGGRDKQYIRGSRFMIYIYIG